MDTERVAAATSLLDEQDAAIAEFAGVAAAVLREASPTAALGRLAQVTATATASDAVLVRTLSPGSHVLVARAVHADSAALAAELGGSRLDVSTAPGEELEVVKPAADGTLPAPIERAAGLVGADVVRVYPIVVDGVTVGTLELMRAGEFYSGREQMLGRLAAAHVGIALRLERGEHRGDGAAERAPVLELVGNALAAGADETEAAEQIVRLATELTGAAGAAVWRVEAEGPPAFLARYGVHRESAEGTVAADAVSQAVRERRIRFESVGTGGGGLGTAATIPLGEPPVGALQLFFQQEAPSEDELELLSPFIARAALALRRSRRVALVTIALRRSQTVIGVVSQAIARLSLTHTLDTAVERIAELTSSGHVAVYLREGERLTAAAARGLAGAHTELAERLLELALGPYRGRGFLFIQDMRREPRLRGLEHVLEESRIARAILVPLVVRDDVIGALGVFKTRPRPYREGEEGLLVALSSQLAVAVQNARLHERTEELREVLERTLHSERKTTRQLRALYEISQSFTESLSLQATLDAVAKTMADLFGVDAAAIRMPDERGDTLETRAIYVADPHLRAAASAILGRPQPMGAPLARRLLRSGRPVLLRSGSADEPDVHRLLEPFLVQGSTAAVLPMAMPGEILGTVTLLSLDPSRPLDEDAVESAMAVAAQAALAIDNARLYQQQKDFSEMMQRALLPRELPRVPGLDVGHVYASSARVDVGGDVYDFLTLDRGRLAVFLGDVTGKGVQAAADMAMAKFSFRALARKWPDPSPFLANANEVIIDEIAPGKFITMLYVLFDPSVRRIACASAGHPAPCVVAPDGSVSELEARGLALGIEPGQTYVTQRATLEPGSAVVLYTDGVIEARRDGELFGEARLANVLRKHRSLGAQALAETILAECRAFSGGDLGDDCAIVCVRLAP